MQLIGYDRSGDMNELHQIISFLQETPPFDALPESDLEGVARAGQLRYFRNGQAIIEAGQINDLLFVIRSGAVELRLAGEDLTARLTAGSSFAYPSLLRGGEVANTTTAIEDTLLFAIPAALFHALRKEHTAFRQFYTADESQRIRHAVERQKHARGGIFDTLAVGDIAGSRVPVSCTPATQVREAAILMRRENVSTLAVCETGQLIGIFTDKDLRNRVVAAGTPVDKPIGEVMTPAPHTLPVGASVSEAMALMTAHGFRHIPLLGPDGQLAGMMSATDILAHLGNNAIDHGLALSRAADADALVTAAQGTEQAFAEMVRSGLQPNQVMRFTSALGEAAHRRAAQLAEDELGPPPLPYALAIFGSLARHEQLIGSDQDNGIVIGGEPDAEQAAYFAALGTRISDILDAAGYDYCRGGIMAKEAAQRLSLAGWLDRYRQWITRPSEDAILRATIFFDMRAVHGNAGLVARLHRETVKLARENPLFISYLARDALRAKVPLGIFGNLVLDKAEDGHRIFDAKAQAIIPLVDCARTLALSSGLEHVATLERFDALAVAGRMARDDARSLCDAFTFVNELRVQHQAKQVLAGKRPDNRIEPASLSPFEREHLKDAFTVTRRALDSLRRNLASGIA